VAKERRKREIENIFFLPQQRGERETTIESGGDQQVVRNAVNIEIKTLDGVS
jgi:hypothetical protein